MRFSKHLRSLRTHSGKAVSINSSSARKGRRCPLFTESIRGAIPREESDFVPGLAK
jgi:hypothetical protein